MVLLWNPRLQILLLHRQWCFSQRPVPAETGGSMASGYNWAVRVSWVPHTVFKTNKTRQDSRGMWKEPGITHINTHAFGSEDVSMTFFQISNLHSKISDVDMWSPNLIFSFCRWVNEGKKGEITSIRPQRREQLGRSGLEQLWVGTKT